MTHVQKNSLEQEVDANQANSGNSTFWDKHKKKVVITSGVFLTVAGSYFGVKHWDKISDWIIHKLPNLTAANSQVFQSAMESSIDEAISTNTLVNLTGEKLTATGLGSIVNCSNQAINKRIVQAGLAEKLPSGGYILTEAGKLYGEYTAKARSWGATFMNIEWDKAILDIVFTQDELAANIAEKARIDALMSA